MDQQPTTVTPAETTQASSTAAPVTSSDPRAHESRSSTPRFRIELKDLNIYYGDFLAVEGVESAGPAEVRDEFHRSVGVR
jgi:hypothetical protein